MVDRRTLREGDFWGKVIKQEDGCWIWTGYKTIWGYGQVRRLRRNIGAHRYSYQELVGPIPKGLTIDHLCKVKSCVNPEHMEVVTREENSIRGQSHPTHCPQGHEYKEENSAYYKGWRYCKTCKLERTRARRKKSA